MGDEIIQLKAGDFEEAVAFLSKTFGSSTPDWFQTNISTCYQPDDELMGCTYAVKREGRIVATAGAFPSEIQVGRRVLKNYGIGGVGVGESCRGQGLMKLLVGYVTDKLSANDCQVSYLGGQRQRYQHYGWERTGFEQTAVISPKSVHHVFGDGSPGVEFKTIELGDEQTVAKLREYYQAQPIYCHRPPQQFAMFLNNWEARPRIAYDDVGQVVGYVAYHAGRKIVNELVARDAEAAVRMLCELVHEAEGNVEVNLPPLRNEITLALGKLMENMGCRNAANWQIFDWPGVLSALMEVRHGVQPLAEGRVVIEVLDREVKFEMIVQGDDAGCRVTDEAADLKVDSLLATRLLCGPLIPSLVMGLPEKARILDAWCPLPLWISHQDRV